MTRRATALTLLAAGVVAAGCGGDAVATRTVTITTPSEQAAPTAAAAQAATQPATTPAQLPATPPARPRPKRPPIIQSPIGIDAKRKADMAAYAERHYGLRSWRLVKPRVIVEHYTVNTSVAATLNAFRPNVPDRELGERPGVCAHFVIGPNGDIHQLVPLGVMCRHTVGLNHRSIGIEHVGMTAQDVLGNPRQLRASLRLTRWLRCRYGIKRRDVIGHAESLGSPYREERVAALARQTHADFTTAEMRGYRARLASRPCATTS